MKDQTAVILWSGDTPWSEVEAQVNFLAKYNVKRICVAAANVPSIASNIPGLTIVHEPTPVGSLAAMVRGINYVKTSFWQKSNVDTSGIFIIYSKARATERLISKMLQISTIMPAKGTDILLGVQLVDNTSNPKYLIGSMGNIERVSKNKPRGHEFVGVLYVGKNAISQLGQYQTTKIEQTIEAMISAGRKIYGVVYECCDSPMLSR